MHQLKDSFNAIAEYRWNASQYLIGLIMCRTKFVDITSGLMCDMCGTTEATRGAKDDIDELGIVYCANCLQTHYKCRGVTPVGARPQSKQIRDLKNAAAHALALVTIRSDILWGNVSGATTCTICSGITTQYMYPVEASESCSTLICELCSTNAITISKKMINSSVAVKQMVKLHLVDDLWVYLHYIYVQVLLA